MHFIHYFLLVIIGHITENESLFDYTIGNTSYLAINDGYLTYQPEFSDNINATEDVRMMCQGNPACIYDTMVTGSTKVGLSTLRTSTSNDDVIQTLGEFIVEPLNVDSRNQDIL